MTRSDVGEKDDTTAGKPGPFDFEELSDFDPADGARIDLGSLILSPKENTEVRLQIDEQTEHVLAVIVVGPESAVEVRAFAAARNGERWVHLLPQVVEAAVQAGGRADQSEGPFGTELICEVPAIDPDGVAGNLVTRVVGIDGPRWLLRVTFMGRPATDDAAAAEWEDYIRTIVVRRGSEAMAPGTELPLRLPPDSQPLPNPDQAGL
jgi:hypothetical protein